MITEPECGSDALNVQTSHVHELDEYHIRGTKHWGGLTGWADYWLITARATTADGKLKRGLDFFLCDMNEPSQHIPVEEMYDSLGLFMIPYGRSNIDVRVPSMNKLEPESTSPRMLLDLLHRSRIQFGCMAMGSESWMKHSATVNRASLGGRASFTWIRSRRASIDYRLPTPFAQQSAHTVATKAGSSMICPDAGLRPTPLKRS